jgi:hypothetical protein
MTAPEQSLIRSCFIVGAVLFLFCAGCADPAPPDPAGISPTKSVAGVEHAPLLGARQIVDRAIAALGGPDIRDVLRRGHVKLTIEGDVPGAAEWFGKGPLTFEAHFDLPRFERRDIYAAPEGEHLLIITNSRTIWFRDPTGKGSKMRAPPPEVYKGPFLIGALNEFIELRDRASKLERVQNDDVTPALDVLDVYIGDEIVSRISFDKDTHLPAQIERTSAGLEDDNLGEREETTTQLSAYRRFGSMTLPTEAVVYQRGKRVFRFVLAFADFETPIDSELFTIPD